MMRAIRYIIGCDIVVILRRGEWNELTGLLMDRGKNWLNSRMNSPQPGENDVD
jgi:hypothetical protein